MNPLVHDSPRDAFGRGLRRAQSSRCAALTGKRLRREMKTMAAMLALYCRDMHGTRGNLCPECRALESYAAQRLERCRFGEEKPTCANCPVHCYLPQRREQVKAVMRHAGPRMLWRHPILAIRHLLDGYRRAGSA